MTLGALRAEMGSTACAWVCGGVCVWEARPAVGSNFRDTRGCCRRPCRHLRTGPDRAGHNIMGAIVS